MPCGEGAACKQTVHSVTRWITRCPGGTKETCSAPPGEFTEDFSEEVTFEMRPGKPKTRMGTIGKENSVHQGTEVSTTWYLVGTTSIMCCMGGCEQERSEEASAFQ